MAITQQELSVLDEFNFTLQPVAVKFAPKKPDNIDRLNENIALCDMIKRAQDGAIFYTGLENHTCGGGLYVVGGTPPEVFENGEFGAGLQIYDGTRAASRLYLHIPRINPGIVNYVIFSPLNKLDFEPDVLVIWANTSQAEILLRAMTYKTGDIWESKWSPAIACAWMLIYPYVTGKMNYGITGLGHGMKRKKLFPENMQMISIPFDLLPDLLQTLKDMPWVLPAFKPDADEFIKKLRDDLGI